MLKSTLIKLTTSCEKNIEKEEAKLSLFADDIIMFTENTKDSTKNY